MHEHAHHYFSFRKCTNLNSESQMKLIAGMRFSKSEAIGAMIGIYIFKRIKE